MPPVNIFDYEELAREKLVQPAFDYIAGGSDDEVTLRRNRDAFESIQLRQRALVDVSNVDLSTTILGQRVELPVLLAPVALQRLAASRGRASHGACGGSRGDDHGPQHDGKRHNRGGRGRCGRAKVVPALRPPRPQRGQAARPTSGSGRIQGHLSHGRRATLGPPRARPPPPARVPHRCYPPELHRRDRGPARLRRTRTIGPRRCSGRPDRSFAHVGRDRLAALRHGATDSP